MTFSDKLPDDQVISRSLKSFDQHDWQRYVNDLYADSSLSTCKDEFEVLVDEMG